MPWTAVPTFTSGQILTADQMNGIGNDLTVLRGNFDLFRRTAGNISLTGTTTWSDLTTIGTGADLTLTAASGDVIEAAFQFLVDTAAIAIAFDVVTVVGSTKTNSLTTGGAVPANFATFAGSGWYIPANISLGVTGSVFYALQAGDISSNTVKLRPQYAMSAATNRGIFGTAQLPFIFYARNHGPVQS